MRGALVPAGASEPISWAAADRGGGGGSLLPGRGTPAAAAKARSSPLGRSLPRRAASEHVQSSRSPPPPSAPPTCLPGGPSALLIGYRDSDGWPRPSMREGTRKGRGTGVLRVRGCCRWALLHDSPAREGGSLRRPRALRCAWIRRGTEGSAAPSARAPEPSPAWNSGLNGAAGLARHPCLRPGRRGAACKLRPASHHPLESHHPLYIGGVAALGTSTAPTGGCRAQGPPAATGRHHRPPAAGAWLPSHMIRRRRGSQGRAPPAPPGGAVGPRAVARGFA